jgi:hypothetical protein
MSQNPPSDVIEVASHDLFEIGDVVEITADCVTTGKQGVIAEYQFGKWEVSFSPQWCGWYLPEQLRKISSANAGVLAQPTNDSTDTKNER